MISVSTDTIQEGLANMGVLITQEYYFTQVETCIDFAKIKAQTDEDRKTITVEMPASEVQSVTIDKDTFKIYSEKDSLWNPLKLEDYNISLVEFEKAATEKALESGILARSDDQARRLVREFIGSLPNTAAYTVVFK